MKYNTNTRKLKFKKNLLKNVIKKRLTKKNKKGGAEKDEYTCIDINFLSCPITKEIMLDPVLAEDGQTYERSFIEEWFRKKQTSPMTNKSIGTKLISNLIVKSIINNVLDESNTANFPVLNVAVIERFVILHPTKTYANFFDFKRHLGVVAYGVETKYADINILKETFDKRKEDSINHKESLTDNNIHQVVEDYLSDDTNKKQQIIEKYGSINNWDVSRVTNMKSLLYKFDNKNYENFNENISNWDVSNVTDMTKMFYYATSFDQPLNNWDVSNVTNMKYMFHNAQLFNQPLDNWNVSRVTTMENMFCDAESFNQPIGGIPFGTIPSGRSNFGQIIGGIPFGTIPSGRSNFGQINGGDIHQYAGDTDGNVVILMEIDSDPGYRRFIKVTKTGTLVEDPVTSRGANDAQVSHNFTYSTAQELIDAYNSATPTGAVYTWAKGNDFDTIITGWNVSNVTNMEDMFAGAESFNQPLNNWDVSNVRNMKAMFGRAKVFNQPLNNWNVSNVTDMDRMFIFAENFNADIREWDVSNVRDMSGMFAYAITFNIEENAPWYVN